MLVFWVLTSNTYAFDLWFPGDFNGNSSPKWLNNKYSIYYCSNNWETINICSADSPWAFWISWYIIGQYSRDFSSDPFYKYDWSNIKWFAYEKDNEWAIYYQAKYKWAVQYYNTFSIPSRTAYQYTNSLGNKFLFSQVFVYHNQFTLYDPKTRYWVSWIGDVKLENMMLIANPWKEEQNVFLIQLQKQKAFSLTVDKNQAREIWKGNGVNKNFLKNLQFEKSYTLTDWGNSLFPPGFKSWNQGINFIYTEDIETQSMDWWGGTTNNQWGNSDGSYKERLAEYNQCASYWQNVKTYTLYDRECYRWLLEDPADNRDIDVRLAPWKAIVDWNWEGELDIKTKDPICLKFKSRKPVYMQKYKEKRDEFIKDSQEYWLNPSQTINVAEKCGTRPVPQKPAETEKQSDFGRFGEALWDILLNQGNKLKLWTWWYEEQNKVEYLLWKYMAYKTACRDKAYMPTKDETVWESFKNWLPFVWWDNNEKVCKYAEKLKKEIEEKYWSAQFSEHYKNILNKELGDKVIDDKWKIDIKKIEKVAETTTWYHKKTPFERGADSLQWYFNQEYNKWYSASFSVLWYGSCGKWIWIKQRDYLVYVPVILLLWIILRWKN